MVILCGLNQLKNDACSQSYMVKLPTKTEGVLSSTYFGYGISALCC